ncbi:diaminopimelate epimerase [Polynucleobacter sp. Latsch14-2]|jgi:diaminopimelate epimerase|uniref:diaminopimelate epimerase n=1 Tax=Polynucleobacter sp. Latsch14-2 TaxID=2576920 RepID=UPI002106DCBA|nr:diaminopimelate epimerase [Polynucleobacter sp. Latsch14-2]MBU3613369.1 diaminopimelate epimerase [Polynucleobacter sp. Latsch14-2]
MNSNSPAQKLRFTKMHGAGNDFIVLNGIDQDLSNITREQWQKLAHRQFGIGADQILLVEKATRPDADFRYRIFNSDGGEVEQCGNGSRCFVRFVLDQGLSSKNPIRVEVAHTVLTLKSHPDGQVEVDMGAPVFEHSHIPFNSNGLASKQEFHEILYALPTSNHPGAHDDWVGVVSMGNPHAVQVVGDIDSAPVKEEGPFIEKHPAFPRRVNAGYMQVISRNQIKLRVYERGAGETLACGTGACAAVVSGIRRGMLDSPVKVQTRGGTLEISWGGIVNGVAQPVIMTGPAVTVFEGETEI